MHGWPAVLFLAILLVLAGWLTGNIYFAHPTCGCYHSETLDDLGFTPDSESLNGFIHLDAPDVCSPQFRPQLRCVMSTRIISQFFCGWNSSSYKEDHSVSLAHDCPGPITSRAFLLCPYRVSLEERI